MPPSDKLPEEIESFGSYLQFVSDMLGGDLFPLELKNNDVRTLVSHRAIDYELIRQIVREVQQHNAVFYLADRLEAYATLDALGKLRNRLLSHKGDIHQISLIDRIGELTVTFFNLTPEHSGDEVDRPAGRVYRLKRES